MLDSWRCSIFSEVSSSRLKAKLVSLFVCCSCTVLSQNDENSPIFTELMETCKSSICIPARIFMECTLEDNVSSFIFSDNKNKTRKNVTPYDYNTL